MNMQMNIDTSSNQYLNMRQNTAPRTVGESTDEVVTMLIAYHVARLAGRNIAAAVRRCVRKLRDSTKDPEMYDLFKRILAEQQDHRIVELMCVTQMKMEQEGLI